MHRELISLSPTALVRAALRAIPHPPRRDRSLCLGEARSAAGHEPRDGEGTMQNVSWTRWRARRIVAALCGVVSLASAAHGGTWTTSQGPVGGWVKALAVDPTSPSTIYAGTSLSGVFKSADSGRTWTPLPIGIPTISVNDVT